MSGKCLPAAVLVRKLLEQRACLQGEAAASRLERLSGAVLGLASPVTASLQFGSTDDGHVHCDIAVSVDVQMQCQRCLEPVTVALRTDSRLRLLDELEPSNLARHVEPVLLVKGELNITELVEEELLLALPIIAKHRATPNPDYTPGVDAVSLSQLCLPGTVTVEDIDNEAAEAAQALMIDGQGRISSRAAHSPGAGGVTRRSEIGEDNPFNVLQSLVDSSEQEKNHGSPEE